ncbi:hypothetical protein [Jannaschia sp. 2305UL9-9]|uniref:hypothetical protein n=1 Tax=Jannaschia sp. 2305UL9-9 TaxID=3121638 RepID=UPI003529A86A
MFDGATTGRGFETALAPWIWGGIAVLSVAVWLAFHIQLRRHARTRQDEDDT